MREYHGGRHAPHPPLKNGSRRGDVTGPTCFSHISEYQAIIACRNMFLPFRKRVDYTNVVWSTFTDPNLAHAG